MFIFVLLFIQLPPICIMPGWPLLYTGQDVVSTGISFADINGNGNLEVIVPIMYGSEKSGTLYVYDHQAQELWRFSNDTIIWLPAFGDLDDDGVDEIVIGTSKGLYAFNGDGSSVSGFPLLFPGCYRIEVAIADVNADDSLDIICFVDFLGDSSLLYVLSKDGQPLSGWPVVTPQYVYNHPAVGDIDNDGTKEVLYTTWLDSLHCYRYDGTMQLGFPVECILWPNDCGPSEIILCDLDQDNYLEIIHGSCTAWADTGALYIHRHDGTTQPGWPKYFSNGIVFHPDQYHFAVGDLDNDQEIEIVITATGRPIRLLDRNGNYLPGSGKYYSLGAMNPVIANIDFTSEKEIIAQSNNCTSAFYHNGEMCYGWPIRSQGSVNYHNSLTVADIDNDGLIELGLVSGSGLTGKMIYIWKLHGVPADIEWGCPYFDLQRTCHYR